MAEGAYTVDLSHWPLVSVICRGEVSDDAFTQYIEALEGILARRTRYATLLDARLAGAPTINQRRLQTLFQTQNAEALRLYCAGVAFVLNSSLLRGVLNAIMWMAKPPFDYTVVETPELAREWLHGQLTKQSAAGHR